MKERKMNIARAVPHGPAPSPTPPNLAAPAVPTQEQLMNYLLEFATQATVLLVAAEAESENEDLVRSVNALLLHPGFNIVGGVLVDMLKTAPDEAFRQHTRGILEQMAARKEAAKRATT